MKSSTSKMTAAILAAAIFSTSGIALANEVSPTGNKASSVAEGRPPVSGISSGISPVPSATLSEAVTAQDRSEENTSELQSLMRSSYAVFCLNKKQKSQTNMHH